MPRASRKDKMDAQSITHRPTVGSLFAGIGGFDIGFENAGFTTEWQVEINDICRAVLADHFPHAKQYADVRTCQAELSPVDVIVGGFPCQDVSTMGKRAGLKGARTSLFFHAINIIQLLKPRWVVLENVPGLISSNDGADLQTVLKTLAQCGYVGFWRVLDARYFGVPQARRRIFILAGLGEQPPLEFMADARAMTDVSSEIGANTQWAHAHNTVLAGFSSATINLSCSNILAVANGRDSMVKRARKSEIDGFLRGLAATDLTEIRAAGNAVVPQVAQWIAEKLIKTFH